MVRVQNPVLRVVSLGKWGGARGNFSDEDGNHSPWVEKGNICRLR